MSASSSTNTSRVISRAYKRARLHRGRCREPFGKNGHLTVRVIDLSRHHYGVTHHRLRLKESRLQITTTGRGGQRGGVDRAWPRAAARSAAVRPPPRALRTNAW